MKVKDFDFRLVMSEAYLENEIKCGRKECQCADFSRLVYGKEAVLMFSDLAFSDNEAHIELFSGFCDKNGKKIYVGDIVKFGDEIGVMDDEFELVRCFETLKINGDIAIEVLGNLHENKELLGKE